METVISALIVVAILVLAILGLTQYSLNSQAQLADASRVMQERIGAQARTGLTAVSATAAFSGNQVYVTVQNTGNTKFADFNQWDVILHYTDANSVDQAKWYAYSTQWSQQITEIVEPNIFNPGEQMVITVNVTPTIKTGTTNVATVTTPNGITASTIFTH